MQSDLEMALDHLLDRYQPSPVMSRTSLGSILGLIVCGGSQGYIHGQGSERGGVKAAQAAFDGATSGSLKPQGSPTYQDAHEILPRGMLPTGEQNQDHGLLQCLRSHRIVE